MTNQSLNGSATQQTPTVSVIMNCLNCAKYLREALDSVFAQTYADWEIVFWDNASTDNSAEIAKSYGRKVRYFRSEKTFALGKARNLAIEQSRGKYIAFLDCDDVWLPTKLEKQIPLFEQNERVGLVYSKTIYFNDKNDFCQQSKAKKCYAGYLFGKLLTGNFISIQTAVIRKSALDDLGEWFDERFNIVEDADLFLRLAYKHEIGYVDMPLAKRRMHKESWSFKKRELRHKETKILINKLKKSYPSINKDFSSELTVMESRASYDEAITCWMNGEKQKARQFLRPFLMIDKKLFFPYILSYLLSYRLYVSVLKICGKFVYDP